MAENFERPDGVRIAHNRRSTLAGGLGLLAASCAGRPGGGDVSRFTASYGGREIPVFRWPAAGRKRGEILFSHGAASSPMKYERLIASLTAQGYAVTAPVHVDSVDHPETAKYPGMASWKARIEDAVAVSDSMASDDYVAMGHSYGALLALTLGGATPLRPDGFDRALRDPRAKAVIAFSPPAPIPQFVSASDYSSLAAPALIQTGTRDIFPGQEADPEAWRGHLAAFEAAAAGGERYALVLDGVDHYFGGAICRFDVPGPPQLAELSTACTVAGLFSDAYGRGSRQAATELRALITDSGATRIFYK